MKTTGLPKENRAVNKVFGIGWAKTGTTSLGRSFEILGYSHEGKRLDLVRELINGKEYLLDVTLNRFDSFEDWPWILLYRRLWYQFPDSKFILTTRAQLSWIRSYREMIERESNTQMNLVEIRRFIYGFDPTTADDQQLWSRVHRHNIDVIEFFSDKPNSLLVVNWAEGDGWDELCTFLEKPIPGRPFPHENRSVDYRKKPLGASYASRVISKFRLSRR